MNTHSSDSLNSRETASPEECAAGTLLSLLGPRKYRRFTIKHIGVERQATDSLTNILDSETASAEECGVQALLLLGDPLYSRSSLIEDDFDRHEEACKSSQTYQTGQYKSFAPTSPRQESFRHHGCASKALLHGKDL